MADKSVFLTHLNAALKAAQDAGEIPVPFFERDELRAILVARHEDRIKRAKEILQICRGVQLDGSVCNGDLSDDAVAQRLADLIWE